VHIDQQLEVYIISVDKEKEKIALGLKQKSPSPWANVEAKYPIGSRHTGEVVNVMSYGAFVKLEPGIEGLVHISEMSWTKRINHPSELVSIGDPIEVQVLNINKEKQEISLGMKQVQPNPWDKVAERYPPGTVITGTVRNLTNYGAFIEIEEGIDGLLHVSDMSWVRKVSHPSEVVSKGDKVTCVVLNVDQERKRVALGLKQMASDPWEGDIPGRYHPGDVKKGKVTKLTNFGVFVELEAGLEGLLHISELADHKVESPEEVVKVGDEIEVKILRVEPKDRKIGLSRKNLHGGPEEETEGEEAAPSARPQRELRGGTGSGGGQLFSMPESTPEKK
jgi:small subunit ribosomal protein S1